MRALIAEAGLSEPWLKKRREVRDIARQADAFGRTTNKSQRSVMAVALMRVFSCPRQKRAIREACPMSEATLYRIKRIFQKFLHGNV